MSATPSVAVVKTTTTTTSTPSSLLDFYTKFDETHGKETRKTWYNATTQAYIEARPRYPAALIQQSLQEEARLSSPTQNQHILEIGCGPGTATVDLVKLGYTNITAIDPAPQNCLAAKQLCEEIIGDNNNTNNSVRVVETTFEDYQHDDDDSANANNPISAILCPTSFHWIRSDVACVKTAHLLQSTKGCLILWWALPPMPSPEVCEKLQDVYDEFDMSTLGREIQKYCTRDYCEGNFGKFTSTINESGYYHPNNTPFALQQTTCHYKPQRFILLLSTLSPYIALPETKRTRLFAKLQQRLTSLLELESNEEETMELTYFAGSQLFWVK